jgi:hypothetical protein
MNVTLPPRLVHPKPRREGRLRCAPHLAFVRSHACCVPGCEEQTFLEAAHVRIGTQGGTSLKPGDNWTISLCAFHHMRQHVMGEESFEASYNIDMKALAAAFWSAFRKINPQAVRRAEEKLRR